MYAGTQTFGATFSRCGKYRYTLRRAWDDGPFVAFVGLNPSTADAKADDPTIRRCIRYAKDWGFGGLVMINLFAYRATNPDDLPTDGTATGPGNDQVLAAVCEQASLVIECWGAHKLARRRAQEHGVTYALGSDSCVLGRTKDGYPRHPLYLPATAVPLGGLFQTPAKLPATSPVTEVDHG
jgi:hypothetical protein